MTSGAGRLFDAVSAILGLCPVATFDSEAPMRLESVISYNTDLYYPYQIGKTVVFADTLKAILKIFQRPDCLLFQQNFIIQLLRLSLKFRRISGKLVILTKLFFQEVFFRINIFLKLPVICWYRNKFEVFTNHLVPANDGGISLGQLVIASKKTKNVS